MKMMYNQGAYILKSNGRYIVSGPRRGRREGCTVTEYKTEAKRFESPEAARAWLNSIREKQTAWGWPSYAKAWGVVCNA